MVRFQPIFRMLCAATAALLVFASHPTHAQQQPITPAPIIPTATPTRQPVIAITPADNDPRGGLCTAYQYPAFERYIVQPGDTLRNLIGSSDAISITSAAALNCLDDPDQLPVGAVIWLPTGVSDATAEPDGACAYSWIAGIINEVCAPEAPRGLTGAMQPFEHGVMIWVREADLIFVLTDDGIGQLYENSYREGDPDPQATAPDGLIVPVRGFGAIWQAMGGESSSIGWATEPEMSAQIEQQAAGRISYTTYYRINERLLAVTITPSAGSEPGHVFWVDLTM